MSIHDELERIAARAPEVAVPADTWARAQRARRRDRYGVAAVVLVVIALAGTLVWLPSREGPDPVDSDAVGVPNRLWPVPERFTRKNGNDEWSSDEVTDDPTVVGVGAAAWMAGWGLPVLVDANEGEYHLLDLPDFIGDASVWPTDRPLALSPDGRRLAYAYAVLGPEAETQPVPSGVRVLDLTTGEMTEVPVPGEEGTIVNDLAWSPDGGWLAFSGDQQSWWTENSNGVSEFLDEASPVVGRVPLGSEAAEVLEVRNTRGSVQIADDGVVTFGVSSKTRQWDGEGTSDVRGGPDDHGRALGILEDGSRLVIPSTAMGARWIHLVAPTGDRRRVIRIDSSIEYTLSVAVGLIDPHDPTVDRPAPEWPTDWAAMATKVAWVAVPGAFLLMLLLPWLRGRLSAGTPTTARATH